MKNVLRPRSRALLHELLSSPVLLAFDFDGTLAPISDRRDMVQMRTRTAGLLREVSELYPCAIITGRSRADVLSRLDGAELLHVVGNHGIEVSSSSATADSFGSRTLPVLARLLAPVPGVEIEDKGYSVTVHYRRAPSKVDARRALARLLRALPEPCRVVGGKLVVNIMPAGAPHKGDALQALMNRVGVERALYVGDDLTDEDVFRRARLPAQLGVRVGRRLDSAARYYVRNQKQVDRLLSVLLRARKAYLPVRIPGL